MTPLVVCEGAFGRAVAQMIRREVDDLAAVDAAAPLEDAIARASCVALVSWRWSDATALRLADAAHAAGIPFYPVQLDSRVLVLGPRFGDDGPCYRCFRGRYLAQAVGAERQRSFWKLYADDADAGVPGFTPPMVRIAASAVLGAFAAGGPDPTVRWFDVLSGDLSAGEVAAIHACPGPHRTAAAGGERFVTALESLLSEEVHP